MELKKYTNMLLRKWWIIMLVPMITAAASIFFSLYVLKPVYESDTTLYIINKKLDPQLTVYYSDITASQQFVKDYREIIKSRAVTSEVKSELNLTNLTLKQLADKINVSSKNDTRLIEIIVQDSDPVLASKIANTVRDAFIKKVVELMRLENINIVDDAEVQEKPVKPNLAMNVIISIFTGLLLAVGIVILAEYLDDTIKTPEDAQTHLGLTILGIIPRLDIR